MSPLLIGTPLIPNWLESSRTGPQKQKQVAVLSLNSSRSNQFEARLRRLQISSWKLAR